MVSETMIIDTVLPWNHAPVRAIPDLGTHLSLESSAGRYLPRSITLFADPEVPDSALDRFLIAMACHLTDELRVRQHRAIEFARSRIIHEVELESFLTERTGVQPWALYYSVNGGLGIPEHSEDNGYDSVYGVIPCSTMQNHGVAWHRCEAGELKVWLATARKAHGDRNWDSDIGHESAHAAFAPCASICAAFSLRARTSSSLVGGQHQRSRTRACGANLLFIFRDRRCGRSGRAASYRHVSAGS
jgi:hypothetical protein